MLLLLMFLSSLFLLLFVVCCVSHSTQYRPATNPPGVNKMGGTKKKLHEKETLELHIYVYVRNEKVGGWACSLRRKRLPFNQQWRFTESLRSANFGEFCFSSARIGKAKMLQISDMWRAQKPAAQGEFLILESPFEGFLKGEILFNCFWNPKALRDWR